MCKVLKVSRGGYYKWLNHKPSKQEIRRKEIALVAEKFYAESNKIYGYRKVLEDIIEKHPELVCAPETLRLIMRKKGLLSSTKRKFKYPKLSEDCFYQYAENKLARDFTASSVNQKWVADITYIRTLQGWLYLACVMDLFSRKIVGWSMSKTIDAELVCDALNSAILSRRPTGELIHHSDRGCQYSSEKFNNLLEKNDIICSMSRAGNPWDNAAQESFFSKLKCEWIQDKVYKSHSEARQDIFKYIEVFYNRKRRHASLGYLSPDEYECRAAEEVA